MWRGLFPAVALAVACLTEPCVAGGLRPFTSADDSVAFRLNPARTNSINFSSGFSPSLKLAWSVYDPNFNFYNTIVAGGTVFVVDHGAGKELLRAFRLSDGRNIWNRQIKSPPLANGAAAYDNGSLFVVDVFAKLWSVSAQTGKINWSLKIPKQKVGQTDPVAVNGTIFGMAYTTAGYSAMYSVLESTGTLQWRTELYNVYYTWLAYDGNNGLYENSPCNYYKLDATTGMTIWFDNPDGCHGGGNTPPIYIDGRILIQDPVVDPARIILYDAANGRQMGRHLASVDYPPTAYTDASGASHVVSLSSDTNTLTDWDLRTRKDNWSFSGGGFGMPVVVNGIVFAPSGADAFVFDGANGNLLNDLHVTDCEHIFCPRLLLSAGDGALILNVGPELLAYVPQ